MRFGLRVRVRYERAALNLDLVLCLGSAATQPPFELCIRRRRDEYVARIEARPFDDLGALPERVGGSRVGGQASRGVTWLDRFRISPFAAVVSMRLGFGLGSRVAAAHCTAMWSTHALPPQGGG